MAILAIALFSSCSGRPDNREREILASLLGREIVVPDSLECRIQDTPISYDMSAADFKIITYIDSAGCTPCKMKLPLWDRFINELKKLDDVSVDFLMILNSEPGREIETNIKGNLFQHPVSFDAAGTYDAVNSLPAGNAYHTLLLDADNRVICAGNPVINPKVRELYLNQILGDQPSESPDLCGTPAYALGIVAPGDTIVRQFSLFNKGDEPVTIQELVPSCYCVSATATADTIGPGCETVITATLVPDIVAGQFSRYIDVFYNEKDYPERLTLHGFIIDKP